MKRVMKNLFFISIALIFGSFGNANAQVLHNDVIINEFTVNNTTGKEWIELLVVKAGGVDLRGFRLSDVGTKGGATSTTEGHLDFPNAAYLSNLQRGTRIVCVLVTPSANTVQFTQDTDPADGILILFSSDISGGVLSATGTLDISTNENIQLLNGPTSTANTIDFVATGTNTSYTNFSDATWVQAGAPTSSSNSVQYFRNNWGGNLNNDTAAVGWMWNQSMADATPGNKNVGQTFPWEGLSDGDGTATIENAGGGTFNGSTIFSRYSGNQTVKVSITGTPAGLLDKVKLTVPTTWSGYNPANVTFGGAFAGQTNVGSGNDIQINGANLGTTPGTITISGLTSPNPVGAALNGNDTWIVQTAKAGGTLTNIAASPISYTIIPISNLRTGGTDGFGNSDAGGTIPVLNNNIVAVQGIITVPNRVLAETTSTSIIIQDGSYGIQVFRSGTNSYGTLTLGKEIVVKGNVTAFNGNTEVIPASVSFPDLFIIGTPGAPSPTVIPNASHISEANEGKLLRINSVSWDSAGQTFIASASNRGRNNFDGGAGTAYLHSVNDAVGAIIPASSDVIGVVYHRTDISGNQQVHKIAPRNRIDLGFQPGDGSGTASITPPVRILNQTGVAETLTVTGDGTFTLEGVSVTIPSSWTWDGSSRTLSGAGFASASSTVSGDGSSGNPFVITVTGAAVTNTNTGTVIIANLGTPSSTGMTTFTVRTRVASGIFTTIASSPTVNIVSGVGFEAVASGNWSNPAIWSGGVVPGPNDNVTMTTLNVTVTIDIPNAQCHNLTMTGSGSASNSGPLLQFASTGSPQLTVNGTLSITGGSGGGGGDRGGRPKLHSNGNSDATLILKGTIVSTSSNTVANGSAGLNMNEGTVRLTGATTDSLKNGAGLRMGHLIVGDGIDAKTFVWAPTTTATLRIRSLTVKSGSTFWIGSGSNSFANDIGNDVAAGVPTLTGGITIEPGAALRVLNFSGGYTANINLDGGGITNHGTIDLHVGSLNAAKKLAACYYNVNIGGFSAGSSSSNQTFSGSQVGEFANITIASGHTLTLQQDVYLPANYKVTVNGTLAESADNTVLGTVEATRTMSQGVDENFGGIGLMLNAAGAAPGSVTVSRLTGSAAVQSGNSNTSIERYFDITAAVNSGLNATLDFYYDNSELAGHDASTLNLWRSEDDGVTWNLAGGTVDTSLRRIRVTGVDSFSRWTAADASRPLGGAGIQYSFNARWNIISVPLTVADYRKNVLFPSTAANNAFAFQNGYVQKDTLENGVGYWLKFPTAEIVTIAGTARTRDTIPVVAGWNMIGTISYKVPKNAVVTIPPGIIVSEFYGFEGGYRQADTLYPARGYWVKVNSDGEIVLTSE